MQNMFATINIQGQPQQVPQQVQQNKTQVQQSSLDLLNSSSVNNNMTDFNTMQNLFATGVQGVANIGQQ